MAGPVITAKIVVDTAGSGAEVQGVSGSIRGLNKEVASGIQAAQVFRMALGALRGFVTSSAKAFLRQEQAVFRANQALRVTGQFSEEASREVQRIASAMQDLTTTGDEAALEIQSVLLALGATVPQLEKATRISIGLSRALGIDVNSAARLVGKAIAGQTDAFSRYGVEIDKAGDVLEQLDDRFGALAAATGSASDQIDQITNLTGDLTEKFGGLIVRSLDATIGIGNFKIALQDLNNALDENGSSTEETASTIANAGAAWLDTVTDVSLATKAVKTIAAELGVTVDVGAVAADVAGLFGDKAEAAGVQASNAAGGVEALGASAKQTAEDLKSASEEAEKLEEAMDFAAEIAGLLGTESDEMTRKLLDNIDEAIRAGEKLAAEQEEAAAARLASIREQEQAAEAARALEARGIEIGLRTAEEAERLRAGFIEDRFAQQEKIEKAIRDENQRTFDEIKSVAIPIASTIGQGLGEAFSAVVTGAKSAEEAFADFGVKAGQQAIGVATTTIITAALAAQASAIASGAFLGPIGLAVGIATAGAFASAILGLLGELPRAQFGGLVRGPVGGRDSVPTLLQPGEVVLPVRSDARRQVAEAVRETGGGGTSLTVRLETAVPINRSFARRVFRDQIEPEIIGLRSLG